jgi:type I restriction enzyme R subunit
LSEPSHISGGSEEGHLVEYGERQTNIRTVDYEIYRQEVEKTLAPLFEHNPVLQKIRAGEPVTQTELDQLNALVHTQNERVDLTLLKEFFPDSAVGVDQLLRTIVGLDSGAIEQKFTDFVQQHHLALNALQQRFVGMLKSEICRRGEINVADLYDQPFQSLHDDGIDGLFQDEQATLIANFIAGFAVKTGRANTEITSEGAKA